MTFSAKDWETRTSVIRGLSTTWIDVGPKDADIVLFLHGYPDTAICWEFQIRALSERFRVIAPFMRGVGDSEPGQTVRRYGTRPVTLDLLDILKETDPSGQRKVYCVGHDLGAVYAWHLTSALCDRAAGLVIINGLSIGQMLKRWKNPGQLRKSWYIYLMQLPLVPELIVRTVPKKILQFAHTLGKLDEGQRPRYQEESGRDPLQFPINVYRSFFREIPRHINDPLTRVSCPVLVLWGSQDAFLMPPRMDELKTDAEDVTVRILEGGHWLHRQEPEKINSLLLRFFEDTHGKRQFVAQERVENHGTAGR
jgi:pimeloyl-ACP methyl ester carboxylesterase